MTVDIALMNAGYRGLLDVVIPERDCNRFIARLESIRPELEAAESLGGDTAHANLLPRRPRSREADRS